MMRKVSLFVSGVAAGAILVGVAGNMRSPFSANAAPSDTYRRLTLFGDIFDKIRADYVEAPDEQKLIESAINGMLGSLDPHSAFLDQKANEDMQRTTRGSFGGLGIEVMMEDGLVKVMSPFDDSPAAQAGIMTNDLITHIDGVQVQGLSLNQAVDRMRGEVDTKVNLKVLRNKTQTLEFTLTRKTIRPPVARARIEGEEVGYIRLAQFNEQSFESIRRHVDDLTNKIGADKIKGFIIDLRNNPGGLLEQSIQISDAFLERGEIVSTRGRTPEQTQRFNARAGDIAKGKPVVVLINGGSASASEIVAGALQDHKRATIVGTRSFGKASVQSIFQMRGQVALKLTTQLYYTPSGRSIQGRGIDPDMQVLQDIPDELKGKDETKGEAALKGHIKTNEEEKSGSSAYVPADVTKDKQLIWAVQFLKSGANLEAAKKAELSSKPETPKADEPKKN
jgi:carboxyl-terminal processing protease